jgi:hypothetical protein
MFETVILFRNHISLGDEMDIAAQYFPIHQNRAMCSADTVIPRYSSLPYYKELEEDLRLYGCNLIQTYVQHEYIASFSYYWDVEDLTPQTWFGDLSKCYYYDGPFVVKGVTNSRKYQWDTHMFAKDRADAMRIASDLTNDSMIGTQSLVFRKYVPLKRLGTGIHQLPFSHEFRFFFLGKKLLTSGFYWSTMNDAEQIKVPTEATEFAMKCAERLCESTNFFVVDIAEKESGGYILIEVNCGTMSGLSECSAHELYGNLKDALNV